MKKINVVNLEKLLDNFSEIEKKISEISEANKLLALQLEKSNRLLTLSQSREESLKEECTALRNVIKGLTQTLENQCNIEDENDRLKTNIHVLENKLKSSEQVCQNDHSLIGEIITVMSLSHVSCCCSYTFLFLSLLPITLLFHFS
uniref:Uncharacterized protein n=1 Tax=Phasianus colchicus TaxID=9054 RepID=A0A669QF25_PHACC